MGANRLSLKIRSTSNSCVKSITAMQYHGIVGGPQAVVTDVQFRNRRLKMIQGMPLIFVPCHPVNKGSGCLSKNPDIGQLVLDCLKMPDGSFELHPPRGISGTFFQKIFRRSHKGSQDRAPVPLHGLHGHEEPIAFLSKKVFRWNFTVAEHELRGLR